MPIVTNTPTRPDQTPWTNGSCKVGISGNGFRAGGIQIVDHAKFRSDPTTGVATVTLEPNNEGELYFWTNPGEGQPIPFQLLDSAGPGPFTLSQLEVTQNVAAGVLAVTPSALNEAIAALAGTYLSTVASVPAADGGTLARANIAAAGLASPALTGAPSVNGHSIVTADQVGTAAAHAATDFAAAAEPIALTKVPLPGGGTTSGFVPTVQSDGSIAYQAQSGTGSAVAAVDF